MKKILSICAMAMFLGASVIGCGGSSTSPPATPAPKMAGMAGSPAPATAGTPAPATAGTPKTGM